MCDFRCVQVSEKAETLSRVGSDKEMPPSRLMVFFSRVQTHLARPASALRSSPQASPHPDNFLGSGSPRPEHFLSPSPAPSGSEPEVPWTFAFQPSGLVKYLRPILLWSLICKSSYVSTFRRETVIFRRVRTASGGVWMLMSCI